MRAVTNREEFPAANTIFGPPEGFGESQVASVQAWVGEVEKGSCDGQGIVVVQWRPSEDELKQLCSGFPLYMTMFAGGKLIPHMLSTDFYSATHPA